MSADKLREFLDRPGPVARLRLTRVRGSSPREEGTEMFVRAGALYGTIGGGQLEHRAIAAARELLLGDVQARHLDVPLGPEIGQCCGGRVEIAITLIDAVEQREVLQAARTQDAHLPSVYILGAGHVGRALADLLQHMPVRCVLIDQREDELLRSAARVDKRHTVLPEAEIARAPENSAFIVLTHDHGLDFLLASAALERRDTAYVGLIGSETKREKFRRYCMEHCDGLSIAPLICPIGAGGSRDKRPAVIAAQVVAEVITVLTSETAATSPDWGAVSHIAAQ